MKYFRILYLNDYTSKKGKFGLIDTFPKAVLNKSIMNKLLFSILFNISSFSLMAQSNKMIDQTGGITYYGHYAKELILKKLPKDIQTKTKNYLKEIIPTCADSVAFSHGQIIDVKKLLTDEPTRINSLRIIPKYELDFYFHNASLGIKKYNLEILLDDYGQILATNWPKKTLHLENFVSLIKIEKFGLEYLNTKKMVVKDYSIDLLYNSETDSLYWKMESSVILENNTEGLYILEMPWNATKISEEYEAKKVINY